MAQNEQHVIMMGKFGRAMKYLLKMALFHNPIDAYISWHRRHLAKRGPENVYKFDQRIYWTVGYIFFPRILRLTNKFTWEGEENLREVDGPFMVVCNHNDALDPFYVGTAMSCGSRNQRIHVSWVSKLGNLHTPIMKSIISYFGTIPLGRGRKMDEQTGAMIKDALRRGQGIGFFPEGSRGKTREERAMIREFHSGAARLCLEHKIPYIPVVLHGRRMFFKGKARCTIGHPVYLDPSLECTHENARLVTIDMHAQVQALFEGKPDIPRSRFEAAPAPAEGYLRPSYAPVRPVPPITTREVPVVMLPHVTSRTMASIHARPAIRHGEPEPVAPVPGQGDLDLRPARDEFKP